MGREIEVSRFTQADFAAFDARLREETALLASWFQHGSFATTHKVGGFELEACLVTDDMCPAPIVESFLKRLNEPLVVPELATFDAEINGAPQSLQDYALSRLAAELETTWKRCCEIAAEFKTHLAMIGILPTVRPENLDIAHMSPLNRYRALNEQIFQLRRGRPISLDITGKDHLMLKSRDVMMESAATSFQIHLQVAAEQAPRVYNWSKILAAPMVAVSANSPFLFGYDLWEESRIPLFEQAVSVGDPNFCERVTFGLGYAKESLFECFQANLERFPVLLPQVTNEATDKLAHLLLHNGTIWRWNRPLIGFASGKPHLRIEHRVVPAGPTVQDSIANAALYFGAVELLSEEGGEPSMRMPFDVAKANFYTAARKGLEAEIEWLDGRRGALRQILSNDLLPRARQGLGNLGIAPSEVNLWLGIIEGRVKTGNTGASWQRAWVDRNGPDLRALTAAYLERQESGRPVHEWTL